MKPESKTYHLDDLLYLMARLRQPESGCPWDIAQDYLSITPSTIEETYEVVDAIEREDFNHLKEELGDLLFQVVFYSQLGKEDGYFDFESIVHELTDKLLRRHPHVFPAGTLESERDHSSLSEVDAVKESWEKIKAEEREKKGSKGVLDDVPVALPSLQRSQKLQKRLSKAGMDFSSVEAVLEKLNEELGELKHAIAEQDESHIEEELGDVLFCSVNLARHLKLDADQSLRSSNNKFQARVRKVESILLESHRDWRDCSEEELDALWGQAKLALKNNCSEK